MTKSFLQKTKVKTFLNEKSIDGFLKKQFENKVKQVHKIRLTID